jgi:hypothetical protein
MVAVRVSVAPYVISAPAVSVSVVVVEAELTDSEVAVEVADP